MGMSFENGGFYLIRFCGGLDQQESFFFFTDVAFPSVNRRSLGEKVDTCCKILLDQLMGQPLGIFCGMGHHDEADHRLLDSV